MPKVPKLDGGRTPSEVWLTCKGCGKRRTYNRKSAERAGFFERGWTCQSCAADKNWNKRKGKACSER